jgi:hypothetical protein
MALVLPSEGALSELEAREFQRQAGHGLAQTGRSMAHTRDHHRVMP